MTFCCTDIKSANSSRWKLFLFYSFFFFQFFFVVVAWNGSEIEQMSCKDVDKYAMWRSLCNVGSVYHYGLPHWWFFEQCCRFLWSEAFWVIIANPYSHTYIHTVRCSLLLLIRFGFFLLSFIASSFVDLLTTNDVTKGKFYERKNILLKMFFCCRWHWRVQCTVKCTFDIVRWMKFIMSKQYVNHIMSSSVLLRVPFHSIFLMLFLSQTLQFILPSRQPAMPHVSSINFYFYFF